jgi:hypothetical protein
MVRRPGRPKVAESERREVIFRFVVTKAEAGKIRQSARAWGVSLSQYLRTVAIRN